MNLFKPISLIIYNARYLKSHPISSESPHKVCVSYPRKNSHQLRKSHFQLCYPRKMRYNKVYHHEATKKKIIKKWQNPFFSQLYTDRLRTIYRNLNKETLAAIQSGELSPQQFAFMTHQEMNPEHWAELIQQKVKRDASKFNTNIEASTDMYTCKKCRSKRCTYYEMQTRSADEPMTIFITCLYCKKHWRQ